MKRTVSGALLLAMMVLAIGGCPLPLLNIYPLVSLSVKNAVISEGSGVVTVTAEVDSPASRAITVQLAFSGTAEFGVDYEASATAITIPAGQSSGSITLTGVEDDIYEGNETIFIDIAGVSGGSEDGNQRATARIQEDDPQPVASFSLTGSPLAENGGVATVTVTLSRASVLPTTVELGFSGTAADGDYTRSAAEVVIPAGQTTDSITLTGVDDNVYEGDETIIVDITGVTNGSENGHQQVIATIQENDPVPTIWLSGGAAPPLAENGGVATVTATLSNPSSQPVTVHLASAGGTASSSDYTFTGNPITIPAGSLKGSATVTGVDDSVYEGDETVIVNIASVINGTDDGHQEVTLTIADDDPAPVVTLSASPLTFAENGGTSLVTVTPSGASELPVVVYLDFAGTATKGTDYSVPNSPIIMSPGVIAGHMYVTAIDDAIAEGNETVIVSIASVTNGTDSGGPPVTLQIMDDDVPAVTVSPLTITVAEGDVGVSFDVVLNVQPSGDVTVTVTTDPQVSLDKTTLTFTPANWNTPQAVTVTAIDDAIVEAPYQGTIGLAAAGGGYDGVVISSVTANVIDNDTAAGVTITESGGNTTVGEPNTTDTYTVVLDAQPTTDVTIAVAVDNGQVSVDAAALTFTPVNWEQPQTVTVTAVDDFVAQGDHSSTISHTVTSGDARYNGLAVSDVVVTIHDDDAAGVTLSKASVAVIEGGATDDYTVVLTSEPTDDVVITVVPDSQLDLGSGAAVAITLTFTSANWDQTQTVTVTAVDDALVEGPHTGIITHTASSTDLHYDGIAINDVTANITDND